MKNFKRAAFSAIARHNRDSLKRSGAFLLVPVLLLASCAQQSPANNAAAAAQIGTNTLNVADAAIAGGDPNMALSVSQSILSSDPGNVQALEHEGDAYYALNRCPAAIAAYQLALKRDPTASAAETGQGRCLLKTDPLAAEQAFMRAVQDDPGNANALNDLGIARDLQGNFAGAVDPYQKALLADPSLTAVEVNLGLSLALSGNGPQALQYLGPLATSEQATPKIRQDYAAALVATGRVAEARQVLAVDLPPDQVNRAIEGFSNLIQQSQSVPPPAPPPPTVQRVPAPAPISATPLPQSADSPAAQPAPLAAAAPPPPSIVAQIHPISPSPPTPAPTPVQASTGTMASAAAVQLGALNSPNDAHRAWVHLVRSAPALFDDRSPQITPVTIGSKTYYRLRVGGFQSKVAAAHFCNELQAAGHRCTPADF
ncbi:SPOR domain-containing protein [Acidocella sp.]|uniref:SPOR domain-containing protein n=1 Tax=Acidocella sp. TaxID=50710 RepID=UPI00260CA709|nr:SPOR domain-containing protein [Acidocella sp.]MDD2795509.1 SPOR domain-containing protein [Acidocella sp.]